MTGKLYYGKRFIIPDWDAKGNHQMFQQQSDGSWVDTYNECTRSQEWIDQHISPYFQLAPTDMSLTEYLKTR